MSAAAAYDNPPPLSGLKLVLAGFSLALANFIVVLDITIANVSVPHISGSLAVSSTQGTWVITSYAVTEAISVPLSGWLASRFGALRVFIFGMIGFGIASFLCGIAPNLPALLMARILQGFCGGPIMPMSQTLLMRVFPREKHTAALGLWAMTTVVAPILGPILGGHISDNWSWPWIFFINLPIVVLCVASAGYLVAGHETPTRRAPVDYIGLILLVIWVGALQIMLDKGRELDWFASGLIAALAFTAVAGFIAFLIWELTADHPIVDLKVLRHRGFTVGVLAQSIGFGAFFATVVLIPLFLQNNLGYTATWAGYAAAFIGVLAVPLAPLVANLATRIDVRSVVAFGLVWLGSVSVLRTGWATEMEFFTIALPQFLQGVGMPFFFIGTTALALGSVLPQETASAAGLQNFMRTLSGAVATSLVTTGWEHGTKTARAELVGTLNSPADAVAAAQAAGLSEQQAHFSLSRMVETEAMTVAADHVFLICTVIFFIAAAIIWLAPKARRDVDLSESH